jgi:hypothetical protein
MQTSYAKSGVPIINWYSFMEDSDMNIKSFDLIVLLFLSIGAESCKKNNTDYLEIPYDGVENYPGSNYVPAQGYVDNAKTAAQIAESVSSRHYGEYIIRSERPFLVIRHGNVWIVRGNIKNDMKGGELEMVIRSKDGGIEKMIHGE